MNKQSLIAGSILIILVMAFYSKPDIFKDISKAGKSITKDTKSSFEDFGKKTKESFESFGEKTEEFFRAPINWDISVKNETPFKVYTTIYYVGAKDQAIIGGISGAVAVVIAASVAAAIATGGSSATVEPEVATFLAESGAIWEAAPIVTAETAEAVSGAEFAQFLASSAAFF